MARSLILHSAFAIHAAFRLSAFCFRPLAHALRPWRQHKQRGTVKVQDVMTRNPRSVTPDATAREAAQLMKAEDVGIVPVVEGSRLVGVVTDRDLAVRVVAEGRNGDAKVREVMSADRISTCRPDNDVDEVMEAMAKEQLRRIPIVDERGTLVGIVAQADIVRKAGNDRKAEQTIERISAPGGGHSQ
jgi:CBS domain-containing protein